MGRRRTKNIDLPSQPVPLADAVLYAEDEIRRAVNEARADFSFIGSREACSGRGSGKKTDRTAGAALKLAEELSAVVLDDGRTIRRPESWLKVFDGIRKRAEGCARPDLIADVWETTYKGKLFCSCPDNGPKVERDIKSWIRCSVLFDARTVGLVSFSDNEILEGIKAARLDPWDGEKIV